MTLYLTILEGPRADQARPILAVADQAIIENVLLQVAQLRTRPRLADRVLRLIRGNDQPSASTVRGTEDGE